MPTRSAALAGGLLVSLPLLLSSASGQAPLPWQRGDERYQQRDDSYREPEESNRPPYGPRYNSPGAPPSEPYPRTGSARAPGDDAYRPPGAGQAYEPPRPIEAYPPPRPGYAQGGYPPPPGQPYTQPYGQPYSAPARPYGQPYTPPPGAYDDPRDRRYGSADYGRRYEGPPRYDESTDGSYSTREILTAGHGFFGTVSKGLASVVEYVFQRQGRPNGYILGQEASGAFVAGLRYGEGILYTKDAGSHRVYWQGPSIGYDAGAEGSKVMMLVYNLHDPEEIYQRFAGVDGSAYLVGGVGVTFQKNDHIVIAPIRSGVGLRFGANIGYLKYTRRPTWNPF